MPIFPPFHGRAPSVAFLPQYAAIDRPRECRIAAAPVWARRSIGKPASVEAISAISNSRKISPSTGCPMAKRASGIAVASGVPS